MYFATAAFSSRIDPMKFHRSVWLAASAFIALGLMTWQVSNVVRIKTLLVTIERKQHVLDSLQATGRQEQILIARLESHERICHIARARLGMIEPLQPPVPIRIAQP